MNGENKPEEKPKHHEKYLAKQKKFKEDVLLLADAFKPMSGNMFNCISSC